MGKEIFITFDEDGNPVVEAKGFAGQGCKAATKPFEDALGVATQTTPKPEMSQVVAQGRAQGR